METLKEEFGKFVRGKMLETKPEVAEYVISDWWLTKFRTTLEEIYKARFKKGFTGYEDFKNEVIKKME